MKKVKTTLRFALATALLISSITAEARSWRINNDATKKPHFADINAAVKSSDVVAGDTLYLDPGTTLSTEQNVTKKVTIIGCGYFLKNSPIMPATITQTVNITAAGSKMEGVEMTGFLCLGANNCTIERCKLSYVGYYRSNTATNCIIRQCYITGFIYGFSNTDTRTADWTIENNIIICSHYEPVIRYLYKPLIRNNYICQTGDSYCIGNIKSGTIENNIQINKKNASYIGSNREECVMSNNVTDTEAAIFTLEGTNDQRYRLKDDSPAKGAATDGGDCGPFGGLYPYVCSGFPLGIPRFESSDISTRPQDGLLQLNQKVVLQSE